MPAGEEAYHRGVFFHRLGDDPAHDRKIFGEGRDRTDWPGVDLSPDGRWLAISVSQGWTKSEVHLVDTHGDGQPVAVAAGEDARFEVIEALDDRLYLFTTSGAPRGRIFSVDPRHPARARWHEIVARGRRRPRAAPSTSTAAWRSVSCTTRRRACASSTATDTRAARCRCPGWAC